METNNQINPEVNLGVAPRLSFKEAVGECISKYAIFGGRARRSEYWWFWLFSSLLLVIPLIIMGVVTLVLEGRFFMGPGETSGALTQAIDLIIVMIIALISLFLLIPSLAVQTRRLHDTGRSGWWLVWGFVASIALEIAVIAVLGIGYSELNTWEQIREAFGVSVVGAIVMLLFYLAEVGISLAIFIFSLQDSHKDENKYGPSPKYQ